ncbi:flagellar hook-associated protein FlgK [Oceanospirillum sp.]|uniref:flagellar hook-associated protein FlgK n=1 Tax=Oceanospirillum sp. TaxID=2021254 RepID=UPI003A956A31
MSDLLKLGYSGAHVHQNALNTTGHNIANVDTPGYSRQQAVQQTAPAFATGEGYYGMGAMTTTVRRISEAFLTQQVRNDTSLAKEYETVLGYAKELDNLLSDTSSSPGAALNEFFAAMESLNDEPDSQPLRSLVMSEASTLVERFNLIDDRYENTSDNLNTQLSTNIQDINRISTAIAELNKEIASASGRTGGLPPNDLMDMRDEKLRELSEYVGVKTTDVADGTVSVFIGDGFPLVINQESFTLKAAPGRAEQRELDVFYSDPKEGDKMITELITGGEMGGLLRFREEVLTPAVNELGRLAITISETFNDQHKLGMNLNNEIGGNFFRDVNERELMEERVTPYQDNNRNGSLGLQVEIVDSSQLTNQDYRLSALSAGDDANPANATFSLRDSDGNALRFQYTDASGTTVNKSVVTMADLKDPTIRVEVDGVRLKLPASASNKVYQGDDFTISPTRNGAQDIRREITDGDEIALASPMRATTASYNTGSIEVASRAVTETFKTSNTGSIVTSLGTPADPSVFFDQKDGQLRFYDSGAVPTVSDLPDGIKIDFDPGSTYAAGDTSMEYDIVDASTGTVLYSATGADAFELGKTQNVIPDTWGFKMDLGGIPANGDAVLVEFNRDGFGDNTNGAAISDLQSEGVIDDGKVTYQDAYANTVEFVGIQTAEANINAESGAAILEQSVSLRESVAGVNLDEEAANLVKFQQAYNASAQLIAVSQQLFSTLISAVGR